MFENSLAHSSQNLIQQIELAFPAVYAMEIMLVLPPTLYWYIL